MGKNIIGRKIRIYRAMQNPPMHQSDLLAKLHLGGLQISQSTLSKIENEERIVSDSELITIAKAMNVDILWLLGEKETLV
ncbi:MAG: helix-turn-helix domain-containing protein [Defluviitaleaceae bacterium]|nr:helix-turn-helix domain-containing protein [Defluviitaleaceae bacterium]